MSFLKVLALCYCPYPDVYGHMTHRVLTAWNPYWLEERPLAWLSFLHVVLTSKALPLKSFWLHFIS